MEKNKAEEKFTRLFSYRPVILILVIGSAISLYFFFITRNFQTQTIQEEFKIRAQNNALFIQNSIEEKINVLRSIRYFFESSISVEREEFIEFAGNFIKFPSVKIYGWVPKVEDQNRLGFEKQARSEGLKNFQILEENDSGNWVPATQRNVYYPVYYVIPQKTEIRNFRGLDLNSIPKWEDAFERAQKRNKIVSTGRLEIEQLGKGNFFGFLLPVYPMAADSGEPAEKNLLGFVIEIIKIEDLIIRALMPAQSGLNVMLLDQNASAEESFLYNSAGTEQDITVDAPLDLHTSVILNAGDRQWLAVFTPTADFVSLYKTSLPWAMLIIGYLLTAVLLAYVILNQRRAATIDKIVKAKTTALNTELTERREAQNQLLKSKQRFQTLVQNIPGAVHRTEVNPPWKVFFISEAVEEITGYKPSDFHDEKVTFQDIIIPSDFKMVEKVIKDAVKSKTSYSVEYGIYHAHGDIRYVQEKGQALYDRKGTPLFIDGVIIDITERRLSEFEHERLHRAVEAKNKELQSIVYIASHDLKSPLVNISGFAEELCLSCKDLTELLQKDNRTNEDEQKINELLEEYIPQAVGFINAGSHKMNMLINGLLQVSRAGTIKLDITKLDMNNVLKDVTESVKFQARQAGAEIIVDDLPPCKADGPAVNQVFSNLINNSLKYLTPERKGRIHVYGKIVNEVSVYCVEDNGMGISEEFHERIFELFHRLNPNDIAGGEGLGLTIVKRILDRLNGSIKIESEEGKGSKFFVTLPKD